MKRVKSERNRNSTAARMSISAFFLNTSRASLKHRPISIGPGGLSAAKEGVEGSGGGLFSIINSFFNSRPKFSTGSGQQGAGFVGGDVSLEHDDGDFDVAASFVEKFEGFLAREIGESSDDAGGAVAEFVVGGFHIDHEIFVDLAELDHDERGDGVEHQLGGRPGL